MFQPSVISLLALLTAPSAFAQVADAPTPPEVDAQRYHPPMDSRKTLWTESSGANVGSDTVGTGRLFLHYMNDPLVWVDPVSGDTSSIVADALTLNAILGVSYDRFRIGLDVPVYLVAASSADVGINGAGLGDVGVDARLTALDQRDAPLGVGIGGRIYVPTATVQTSLGSNGVVGEIALLADKEIEPIYLTANLGTRFAQETLVTNTIEMGNQFLAKVGIAYSFDGTDAGLSLDGNTNVNYKTALSPKAAFGSPVELLGGGWARVSDDWVLRAGAGGGVTSGIGSPTVRAVLSIAFERPLEGDKDGDGIMDLSDACPNVPEDIDQFEDENGCPDPDNDEDGLVDAEDRCPLRPEDPDGYQDEDGCPDISSPVVIRVVDDGTGEEIASATLQITGPEDAAGAHGMEASLHEGTYTVHASAANYPRASMEITVPVEGDVVIRMAAVPGTLKIVAQTPGGQRIPGATYTLDGRPGNVLTDGSIEAKAPTGDHVLVVRAEGYAPSKQELNIKGGDVTEVVAVLNPTKVKITRERIELRDSVFFDTGKATIKDKSFALLNEVSQIILDYPEVKKVRIEGHTDSRGSDTANQKLSEERAASVLTYLLAQGVGAERLNSIGYGESKPLVNENNAAAWDKNRRVDFFVEEWDADAAPER